MVRTYDGSLLPWNIFNDVVLLVVLGRWWFKNQHEWQKFYLTPNTRYIYMTKVMALSICLQIHTYIHRLTNTYIHITGYASDVWRLYNLHLTSVTWTESVSVVLLCSRGTVAIGNIFSVFQLVFCRKQIFCIKPLFCYRKLLGSLVCPNYVVGSRKSL